jgi:hypothetical protein
MYSKAVQARMAKIFNNFHFQIFVQMFVFNSDPGPKNNTPIMKNRREILSCKKNAGVGGYFIWQGL